MTSGTQLAGRQVSAAEGINTRALVRAGRARGTSEPRQREQHDAEQARHQYEANREKLRPPEIWPGVQMEPRHEVSFPPLQILRYDG